MLSKLDAFLSSMTMYKVILWALRILAAISLTLSFFGILDLSFKSLLISLGLLSASVYLTNHILSRVWKVPVNVDSYPITLLILFFILPPGTSPVRMGVLVLAGIVAVASKFMFATGGKHIFNPAAFAAGLLGVLGLIHATWWIGSTVLWPFTLLFGLLVVRKIRHFSMVLTFAGVSLGIAALGAVLQNENILETLRFAALASPLIFLGCFMLTEPSTMPGRRRQQLVFGALVGMLYATHFDLGVVRITPELALLIGNTYAFFVSPRYRLQLQLQDIQKLSDRIYTYVFKPNKKPVFLPGQYMEWTLDTDKRLDSRGNRRTFSFASSPTENEILLGAKFYDKPSTYKQALKDMGVGTIVYGGPIAGDFVLPDNTEEKLAFIAGGIGITPFRSMLKYIIDTKQDRDIVLIYAVSDAQEVAYTDVLREAGARGVRITMLLTGGGKPAGWQGSTGRLDAALIQNHISDYAHRTFYLSGPNGMVEAARKTLKSLNVEHIKTDYFTGY